MTLPLIPPATPGASGAPGWASRGAWCILHTSWGGGAHFLRTWAAWQADPQRPALLHYVAVLPQAPDAGGVGAVAGVPPALVQALRAQCAGLGAGQHRLCFAQGHVLLTLCVGPLLEMLREQQFDADALYVEGESLSQTPEWAIKALARRCRRGTRVHVQAGDGPMLSLLAQCGFVLQPPGGGAQEAVQGVFDPRWALKNTREPWRRAPSAPGRCAVIGAGISGASVAASLARRGWQVDVFDQADQPAQGASGLPVGLVVPLVSADDNVVSRLTRAGVRLSLQQAGQWLQAHQDWAPSGVQEQRFDDGAVGPVAPLWHAQAGWVKPAAMVQAWLSQAGVRFHGGVRVQDLRHSAQGWTLLDADGQALATVARVVLANATGALPLLRQVQTSQPGLDLGLHQLPAVHGVRGMVSWAAHDVPEQRPFPPGPVNGNGSLIPFVPHGAGLCWFLGASYQPQSQPEWPDDKNHGANVLRLDKLLPALSDALAPVFDAGALQAWKGVRCVTADRLPLVGPVLEADAGLWICAGMGSRGLSHAALCAELLAAHWAGEPLPVEASLAQALQAKRKLRPARATVL